MLHPEIDPEMKKLDRRNLEAPLKAMAKSRRASAYPCVYGSQVRKRLTTAFGVDRGEDRRRRHGLHIADHGAALGPFRICPIRMSEPSDAMLEVI